MPVRLPIRERITPVDDDDPLRFYYMPVVGRFYLRRLELASELLAARRGRLLELGYGSGVFLPELAGRGFRIVGADRHRKGAAVRAMARGEGVEADLVTGDLLSLPFATGRLDVVCCLSVLEHVRALDAAFAEIRRVLRPGGTAVLGYPRVDRLMGVLFRAIGFEGIEAHHVSTPRDIEAAAARALVLEVRRPWPPGLPLYTVSRWRVPDA
jgi:SAM-dependent methyltransferase